MKKLGLALALLGLVLALVLSRHRPVSPDELQSGSGAVAAFQIAAAPKSAAQPAAIGLSQVGRGGEDALPTAAPGSARPSIPSRGEALIVRTAELRLIVKDAGEALALLTTAADQAGGYVADSRSWREQELVRAHVAVRVPAPALPGFLAAARRLAVRVDQESASGQDVTEEFTDLRSRLVNLEATERELRELLTVVRRNTGKASEVLRVYQELVTVRGEIERVKGRIQYLGARAALATINVELSPEVLVHAAPAPSWRPFAAAANASRALADSLKWLADLAAWFTILVLPLAIVIAAPAALVYFAVRRMRRGNSASGTPA